MRYYTIGSFSDAECDYKIVFITSILHRKPRFIKDDVTVQNQARVPLYKLRVELTNAEWQLLKDL